MKKAITISLLILLTVINVAWYFKYRTACSEFYSRIDKYQNQLVQAESISEELKSAWRFAAANAGTFMNKDIELCGFHPSQPREVQTTVGEPRLVIYLSDKMCSTCLDQLLFEVRKQLPENLINRVLVICQFEKDEETVVWDSRRLMLPGADFVRIRRNQPFFSPDNPHDPVMFITGKNRRIEFPFVSKPSTEELVGIYLTSVKQQLINCL